MTDQWIRYINNFDLLLQEALRICVKNTLKFMYETLHGYGSSDPSPILKVYANLKNNRVSETMVNAYYRRLYLHFRR